MFEGTVFGKLDQSLQHALEKVGYKTPTPIQNEAIPALMQGKDLIGCAQTGTGKTAAFMLPILNHLVKVRRPRHIGHPRALVLSPTRELAVQTAENVKKFSVEHKLPFACLIGGVSQHAQVKDIQKGAETLIACPGRLIDLMTQGIVYLDQVECFVLDEADRMLDMGFLPDVKRIISKLPKARQSMFFSATMSKQVTALANEMVSDPVRIEITPEAPTVDRINQKAMLVSKKNKDPLLLWLLENHPEWKKVIVFSKMRHAADRINKRLFRAGVKSAAIHSDKTQNQRTRALDGFKRGEVRVLVATDIASRGIDVPFVDLVVNTELPLELESYVHRIGRTARAGESGAAISFVTEAELPQLKNVERFIRKSIPLEKDHPFQGTDCDVEVGKVKGEGQGQGEKVKGEGQGQGEKVKGEGQGQGEKVKGEGQGEKVKGEGQGQGEKVKGEGQGGRAKFHGKRKRISFKGRNQSDFGRKPIF